MYSRTTAKNTKLTEFKTFNTYQYPKHLYKLLIFGYKVLV